ncbi:excinuclease ABC subunit UvrC [Dermatophilus congolensis]|uniref:excinuclease ABC subunit UvrC n=1 Tax=Dermatophilus congolensis TaxID=1863 RepID=UPI001AAEFEDB|nr:excinuclease ABC subunit UvrC [Dermatophilus congolensis]MBO3131864.1 excinuclease ABC subunit UvrC [Dermatophilus congolensis]MBO3133979.1 excinuclease ABC subunit UvrC [Dermatophilus congolensis]MBO3136210.1 excinuclease ABC subunit UvrC [Dermatophilus congolensis]MBO3138456.1 excinuclease ABC subunit UvrC [Dermatophilus congolensis]
MSDPSHYRPRPGEIPTDPGVYRFRDPEGRVIYVGKAKSLRPRLSSYFQDLTQLHPRTRTMVTTASRVEWTVVSNEVEALQLEYSWIKEFDPRFNVKYRDDKSYPYLAVTMAEKFPRALVMRGNKKKGNRYFGPYTHAWAIRETLDLLLRVFPVRTCSAGVFRRAEASGRPCLFGYIDKCAAPCVGRVNEESHRQLAEDLCDFLEGNSDKFVTRLEKKMRAAAADLDFEQAARLRDHVAALKTALAKTAVVLGDATDADVFGLAGDDLEVSVQVFHVRGGRIKGQRGWVAERQDEDDGRIVEHLLQRIYGGEAGEVIPHEVLVPALPADDEVLRAWMGEQRGANVALRIPQRGDKKALLDTVTRNAEQALARHKLTRAGDLTNRSRALQELQDAIGLDEAPLRIECYDISHIQGTNVVGSMVVFEDGLPRKSEYRRFVIRGTGRNPAPVDSNASGPTPVAGVDPEAGNDDTAAMREVLQRRFTRRERERAARSPSIDEQALTPTASAADAVNLDAQDDLTLDRCGRPIAGAGAAACASAPTKFAYSPQLVVVDGGLPQVRAAQEALDEIGVDDVVVVGLAKRLEEIWLPDDEFPIVLPRTSEGLFLLQRLRDEAHRFAITFHRQRRSTAMTRSALDGIPGLGESKRKALLSHFGSVKRIREATPEELTAVKGIGPKLAEVIVAALAANTPDPSINIVTGEVS